MITQPLKKNIPTIGIAALIDLLDAETEPINRLLLDSQVLSRLEAIAESEVLSEKRIEPDSIELLTLCDDILSAIHQEDELLTLCDKILSNIK